MKKKYLIYGILPIMALALLVGGTTYAATAKSAKNTQFNSIAAAIAKKFNLNTADVQAVINDTMTAERAQMTKNRPVRVDPVVQAVKDGKLTQAQADLITTKKAELKTAMDSLKGKTPAERTAAMKIQTDALKKWATDNNISQQYIMGFGGIGKGRGGEGFGKSGMGRGAAPASNVQPVTP